MTACKLAGVSYDAVNEWLRKAETDAPDGVYYRLRQDIDAAEAAAEDESLQGIRAAGEKDWKAHAAFLGRRHRSRWSEQPVAGGESGAHGMTINIGIALPGTTESAQVIEAQVVNVPELPDTTG